MASRAKSVSEVQWSLWMGSDAMVRPDAVFEAVTETEGQREAQAERDKGAAAWWAEQNGGPAPEAVRAKEAEPTLEKMQRQFADNWEMERLQQEADAELANRRRGPAPAPQPDPVIEALKKAPMPESMRELYTRERRHEMREHAIPWDLLDGPGFGLLKTVPARRW